MEMQVEVKSTALRVQSTKKGNRLFWQKVGLINGDEFPVVFNLFRGSVNQDDNSPDPVALNPGKYIFMPVFESGQYGDLQISAFDSKVRAIGPENKPK